MDLNNTRPDILNMHSPNISSTAAEYTLFSKAKGTFSRRHHMLGHKTSLSKFKKTNYVKHLSDHNVTKLEIHYKKKIGKFTTM